MRRQGIPDELVEEVIRQTDIVEVIGRYVKLAPSGRYWKGLCPFHGEKSPSFTVTPEKRIFHCFGCGKGGNALHFLMQIEGWSFTETIRTLAQEASIPVGDLAEPEPDDEATRQRKMIYDAHALAKTFYNYVLNHTEEGQPARDYMVTRQFNQELVNAFELGYAPARKDALVQLLKHKEFPLPLMEQAGLIIRNADGQWIDRFRDRFMFPIVNAKGNPVAFGGRILGEGQPKYLNSPESPVFHKGKLLFRLSEAKHEIRKSREAVLFEGYVDVIRAWEAGIHNGIASLGTAFTEEHAVLLKRIAEQVTICYDADEAGLNAAEKASSLLLKQGFRVRVAVMPPKQDPDTYILEFGAEKFRAQILAQALSVPGFLLMRMRGRFHVHEDEGKLAFVDAALHYLASLELPAEREYYTKELSVQTGISLPSLLEQLQPLVRKFGHRTVPNEPEQTEPAPYAYSAGRNDKFRKKAQGPQQGNRNQRVESEPIPVVPVPVVLPAHVQAERHLLAGMLVDAELAYYIQQHMEEEFLTPGHAAVASYLFAFYASGKSPDGAAFSSTLHDESLERIVSALLTTEPAPLNKEVLQDYFSQIRKARMNMELEQYKEQQLMARRAGDFAMEVELTVKINSLVKQLKEK